ncbi:MAG: TonB-dependent receptor, partial [Xanthomonadales bacterium]|nr:TonB-dependent receptor [Xanthomonadales bacterium]
GDPALPGYRIRENANYIDSPDGQAFYEDQLYFPVANSEMAVNNFKNTKVYATADYSFGNVDWDLDFLYTNRNTIAEGWRQFFPQVGTPNFYSGDPGQFTDPFGFISLPVMPYISNSDIDVDYYYLSTGLSGVLNTDKFWSWQVYGSYSYSDGDYTRDSILASRSGDLRFDANGPVVNYFSTPILNGTDIQSLIDAVGVRHTGNTIYDQAQIVGILSGDLMELPAGTLGTAFGLEYRTFSIDDQPSIESRSGDLWGESSALVTKGDNSVIEAFLEADIPLIANKPGIESLTLNGSVRGFDYDKGGKDVVWKAGLNWQIIPSLRLRSTVGTSYRAPALFEQFLGNETSFADQFGIDPCIEWGLSNNENLRANCGSLGIPDDYNGGTASISATIIAGGGVDNLESETSDSFTAGFVFTPEGTDLNIAVDYFDITVNNQIAQLGAGSIVFGCYGGENFPNAFCDLVERAPASSENPFLILTVQNNFVNVNEQATKGVDLNMSWNVGFDAGDLQLEAQSTWVFENISRLFEPGAIEGFDEVDQAGRVSSPEVVANLLAAFSRNDWTVTYRAQYVSATDNEDIAPAQTTYQGIDPAFRDNTAEAVVYHNLSFFYAQDKWDVLVGINNLLDEAPATMSDGAGSTLRGNSPLFATQYDLFGRRVNARLNFRF